MTWAAVLRTVVAVACLAPACTGPSGTPTGGASSLVAQPSGSATLASPAFPDGGSMPARFTCDGEDLAPPVDWRAAEPTTGPGEVATWVLLLVDLDAPRGPFVHWLVYDILRPSGSFPDGAAGGTQGRNDFGDVGYGGPCPPKGDPPHRYELRLYFLPRGSGSPATVGRTVGGILGGVPDDPGIAVLRATYSRA